MEEVGSSPMNGEVVTCSLLIYVFPLFTSAVSASGGVVSYSWEATGEGADQVTYRASLNGGPEFAGECINVSPAVPQ